MSIEQISSLLIQLGFPVLAAGILYGLQLLVRETDSEGRKQIERRRESRRLSTQQRINVMRRTGAEGKPVLAPELSRMEVALWESVARIKPGNPATALARPIVSFEIGETPPLEDSGQVLVTWT